MRGGFVRSLVAVAFAGAFGLGCGDDTGTGGSGGAGASGGEGTGATGATSNGGNGGFGTGATGGGGEGTGATGATGGGGAGTGGSMGGAGGASSSSSSSNSSSASSNASSNASSSASTSANSSSSSTGGNPVCTPVSITFDTFTRDAEFGNPFRAGLTANIGGALVDIGQIEFYANATGNISLSTGANANYSTCNQCARVFEDVPAMGNIARQYFQDGGSINIQAGSTPQDGHLVATITGLTLEEVTIGPSPTFTSTPVVNGQCLTVANTTINLPAPPGAWNCDEFTYSNHDTCDCECGAADPDCTDTTQYIIGCGFPHLPAEGTCNAGNCAPAGTWSCNINQYDDGAACNCLCGAQDPDCIDPGLTPVGCSAGQHCNHASACVGNTGGEACASAPVVTEGTYFGTLAAKVNDINLTVSGCTGFATPGPDQVYAIALAAGQTLVATLASAGDPALYILSSCTNPDMSCVGGSDTGGTELLVFTAPAAGTYFVVVDADTAASTLTYSLDLDITP